ncbi:Ger(x)C family spore germination protein [Fictibacillus sp. NPDC058756]|uniref:Ger(x)C family spore germination protein n=1 Tax=Fictibacillus sp. NPDC058756 TaxID=3346625 RepID=UPI0036960DFF
MKSKGFKLLIIFMSLNLLCGCWDIKDIDKRAFPLVMGISKENEEDYKVTLQIPIPQEDNKLSRTVTGSGKTVANILGKLSTNFEDAIDYSQIRLIVIQSDLAKNHQELKKLIKFLMASEEIPSRALVSITDDKVETVLSNINKKLGVHASSIYDFFNKGAGWAPEIFSIPIWEVYRSLFSYTRDVVVPVVRSGKDTVLTFEGAAIFKKGKFIETISPDESQLVNLFRNNSLKGRIESLGFASIIVTSSSIQNETSLKDNIPLVSSNLRLKMYILERKEGITNTKIKKEIEKLTEKRFYHLLKSTQENRTDILGFGQQFQQQISYQELKDWRNEYYPKMKVDFKVQANME